MANKSLGTLTLDLIAKVGGFVAGMDKAERSSAKWAKQVKRNSEKAGKALGAAVVASVSGLALLTANLAKSGREIENLSRVSGASTTDFQKMAFAANRFGIDQEKVSDILKDTNDRIGDFLQTGGGPMVDFFENIAPLVGVTADEFARLSGPDALQLYVSSLEKAGASQQEMTFFMEALAGDATLLLPLLRDNGKELAKLGKEAEETGNILSTLDLKQLEKMSRSTNDLKSAFTGMRNEVVLSAVPAINELTQLLGDEETVKNAKALGDAIVLSVTAATTAILNTVKVTRFLSEELASNFGAASGDLERLGEEASALKDLLTSDGLFDGISDIGSRIRVGLFDTSFASKDEIRERLAVVESDIQSELERIAAGFKADPILDVPGPIVSNSGTGIGLGGSTKKETDAISQQIKALLRQAEVVAFSADAAALYALEMDGATDSQLLLAAAALETIKDFEDQAEAQIKATEAVSEAKKRAAEEIARVNDEAALIAESLKGEEQLIRESYERRKQIVLDSTADLGQSRASLLIGLEEKLNEDLLDLNAGFWEKYLAAAEENLTSFDQITADTIGNFASGFGDAFESMIFDAEDLGDAIGNLADGMARSIVGALGEMAAQWLLYQGVQILAQKTTQATAATTISANADAASLMAGLNAFSSTAAIPIVGPALAPAAMAVAIGVTSPLAASISAISLSGVAHDGLDSVPQTGTFLLEKGERVTTSETSAKLDRTLSEVKESMKGGGNMGNVRIINQFDNGVMKDYLGSSEGEKIIMNAVSRNRRTIGSY